MNDVGETDQPTVAIVGAGPVGLVLALSLVEEGVKVRVIERRVDRHSGSRSIGVHPPSLELLDDLGLSNRFLERGVRVTRGLAFGEGGQLGTIDFDSCPGPHRYVLAIPQEQTEAILRDALEARAPGSVEKAELVELRSFPDDVSLHVRTATGALQEIRVPIAVGCDGKHSVVRRELDVPFDGDAYPGRYVMADFPDRTQFGSDAAIFLGRQGLVESFPLPGGIRRWVARCEDEEDLSVDVLIRCVARRAGMTLDRHEAINPSYFRAERFLARQLSVGRVALAGDAAHVVSPIGGQGMNLGWLGGRSLARTIASALARGRDPVAALAADAHKRARLARAAARRAEVNMWLGRPVPHVRAREQLVQGLLTPPIGSMLARVFTMRGLSIGV